MMEDNEQERMVRYVMELAATKVFLLGQRGKPNHNSITVKRRFKSHYGVTPKHVVSIWDALTDSGLLKEHQSAQIEHLLWTLDLLKTDATEHVLRGRYQADEKTIRKWTTIIVTALSDLNEVRREFLRSLLMFF